MEGVIAYFGLSEKGESKLLLKIKKYQCRYYRAYYGIIVIEDIARALPGTSLGTFSSETLTITVEDEKLVLVTSTTRLETGVATIGLTPKLDKHGRTVVEVIKPYEIIV
jgi:hypothetical protein